MSDQEQLHTLDQGVAAWNQWRQANPKIPINFVSAALRRVDLRGANFHGANLYGADLSGADLGGADLREAVLLRTDLRGTGLRKARLEGVNLQMCRGLTQGQLDSAHTDSRTQVLAPLQVIAVGPADQAAPLP